MLHILRFAVCAAAVVLIGGASVASSQTIYEPVRYQYNDGGNVYYYGGADPRVHAFAAYPAFARHNGFAFASGNVDHHREVCTEPSRVFLDAVPFRNAVELGATVSDAVNDANARVPLYFRKRDLVGYVQPDGSVVVPAQAPPVDRSTVRITRSVSDRRVEAFPKTPLPILIVPLPPKNPTPAQPTARL